MKTIILLFGMLLTNVSFCQETTDSTKIECCQAVNDLQQTNTELTEAFIKSEKKRFNLWRLCYVEGTVLFFIGGVFLLF